MDTYRGSIWRIGMGYPQIVNPPTAIPTTHRTIAKGYPNPLLLESELRVPQARVAYRPAHDLSSPDLPYLIPRQFHYHKATTAAPPALMRNEREVEVVESMILPSFIKIVRIRWNHVQEEPSRPIRLAA